MKPTKTKLLDANDQPRNDIEVKSPITGKFKPIRPGDIFIAKHVLRWSRTPCSWHYTIRDLWRSGF